jgi:hypothetical protein
MNVKFSYSRDGALEVALASRHNVQKALSSMKHGISKSKKQTCPFTVKHMLYGDYNNIKTLAIDEDNTETLVAFRWYSLCDVQVCDLKPVIRKQSYFYTINFLLQTLHLYVLTQGDLLAKFAGLSNVAIAELDDHSVTFTANSIPVDFMNLRIRSDKLNCSPKNWEISVYEGVVYTVFKGNVYEQVMCISDVVFTNNTSINVRYMGKMSTAIVYNKYLSGDDVDGYVGAMLYSCSDSLSYDYSTMAKKDMLKKFTIRDQVGLVSSAALTNSSDPLTSKESKLISNATSNKSTLSDF